MSTYFTAMVYDNHGSVLAHDNSVIYCTGA